MPLVPVSDPPLLVLAQVMVPPPLALPLTLTDPPPPAPATILAILLPAMFPVLAVRGLLVWVHMRPRSTTKAGTIPLALPALQALDLQAQQVPPTTTPITRDTMTVNSMLVSTTLDVMLALRVQGQLQATRLNATTATQPNHRLSQVPLAV